MSFQPIGTDHLAPTIAAATKQLGRQAAIIDEIRELHQRMYYEDQYAAWDYCEHCNVVWPCETMRIVERVPQ